MNTYRNRLIFFKICHAEPGAGFSVLNLYVYMTPICPDFHFSLFRFADNVEYYVIFHMQSPRVFVRFFFNITHLIFIYNVIKDRSELPLTCSMASVSVTSDVSVLLRAALQNICSRQVAGTSSVEANAPPIPEDLNDRLLLTAALRSILTRQVTGTSSATDANALPIQEYIGQDCSSSSGLSQKDKMLCVIYKWLVLHTFNLPHRDLEHSLDVPLSTAYPAVPEKTPSSPKPSNADATSSTQLSETKHRSR